MMAETREPMRSNRIIVKKYFDIKEKGDNELSWLLLLKRPGRYRYQTRCRLCYDRLMTMWVATKTAAGGRHPFRTAEVFLTVQMYGFRFESPNYFLIILGNML